MTMKNLQKVKKLVEVFPAPRRRLEAELIRRKNQGFPVSLKYLANEAIEIGLDCITQQNSRKEAI